MQVSSETICKPIYLIKGHIIGKFMSLQFNGHNLISVVIGRPLMIGTVACLISTIVWLRNGRPMIVS